MCSYQSSKEVAAGNCHSCGAITNHVMDIELWYYIIPEHYCPSCARLLLQEPYNPQTDGNVVTGYDMFEPENPEQLAFELSMQCGGLMYSLPDDTPQVI